MPAKRILKAFELLQALHLRKTIPIITSNKIIIQTVKIANIYTAKQFSDAKVRFYMTDKINDSNNFNNIHNSKTDIENSKANS
ncbi:hypothetical protein [Orientia tsutsugamushi]|nr:hypothetical protein [Orientia tsutsugamushi]